MIQTKYIPYVLFGFVVISLSSYFGNKIKSHYSDMDQKDEYDLVKKYMLDDSALYGDNRPKLWVHTKYEMNSRQWKNFHSRNTMNLNQPYLYVTIQSIINHCGDDFHVCLIDDETFPRLISGWEIDLSVTPEPMNSQYREIGMMQLIYLYGGLTVPNSFVCSKSLIDIYQDSIKEDHPIIFEKRKTSFMATNTPFVPNPKMICAKKGDTVIQNLIYFMNSKQDKGHFTLELEFLGEMEKWCHDRVCNNEMSLIDGTKCGVKTKIGKPILLENLMSDGFLDVDNNDMYGIVIPADELLSRPNYQWFAILPYQDVLNAKTILSKYMAASMVDSVRSYYDQKRKSVSMVNI
jgi:hypothetical protein|tara:strand:- start:3886 stop:4929 length:1044 start_codon:yes stop_codon:yes gene_type:complete